MTKEDAIPKLIERVRAEYGKDLFPGRLAFALEYADYLWDMKNKKRPRGWSGFPNPFKLGWPHWLEDSTETDILYRWYREYLNVGRQNHDYYGSRCTKCNEDKGLNEYMGAGSGIHVLCPGRPLEDGIW